MVLIMWWITLLELICSARYRIDAFVNHTRPNLVAEITHLREALLGLRQGGLNYAYYRNYE